MHSGQYSSTTPSSSRATSTETSIATSQNTLPPKTISSFYYRGVKITAEMPEIFTKVECCIKKNHLPGELYYCTSKEVHLLCRHCLKHEQPDPYSKQPGTPDNAPVYRCPIDNSVTYRDQFQTREINSTYLYRCPSNTTNENENTLCEWHGPYSDLLKHIGVCGNFSLKNKVTMLQHACSEATESHSALDKRLEKLIERVGQMEPLLLKESESLIDVKIESLDKKIDSLNQQLQTLTRNFNLSPQHPGLPPRASLTSGLQQRITDLENQLADAFHLIDQLLKAQSIQGNPLPTDGILLWKIDQFNAKRKDAINGKKNDIFSPVFFTNIYGYKLCARLYPNGDGMGKGTHISLFLVVMKGDYDETLRWPFRHKVHFTILGPTRDEDVHDAFRPDPNSSSFQRPRKNCNIASGCPTLLTISTSNLDKYVRNDTMFIKIRIDSSEP
ncbi:hypothetical protein [Salinisphaera sp. G21_0]|uniref:hypothetical protein n=1 Tax=Salinisphaera sp. G21_0 TaxID=2821094 RepID=UPI001AD9CC7C|nr:hypothetical protein [Salinisphaera sp. G21_0]MBO9482403.1 hypothetical protein [Salinisphaera sp. G21_0]